MPNRCLILFFSLIVTSSSMAGVQSYFDSIKSNPQALYAFFEKMPKGGELHYHFTGSAYPEHIIEQVRRGHYCIDPKTFALTPSQPRCNGVDATAFLAVKKNEERAIRAWSMKSFIPTRESKHDHFFNVFAKVNPVYDVFYTPLLVSMMNRAAKQHELYMEIMMSNLGETDHYVRLIHKASTLADKKRILLADHDFQQMISQQIRTGHTYLDQAYQLLDCNQNPTQPVCSLVVRFQFWVRREEPLDSVFVQALAGFAAAAQSSSPIVGVNLVQPERGTISRRDFDAQMRLFEFLHKAYPNVHIALHAGELEPKTTPLQDLRFHINHSVHIGHAERIGHGVSILHEDDHAALTQYMAQQHIAVELNLKSNQEILSIEGNDHPILYYLKQGVPIVLSTDDEGILYTDLTQQYVEAVLKYGIDYQTLKGFTRNALTYSFLPGQSLWINPRTQRTVPACERLQSVTCQQFVKTSEKARLQLKLEQELHTFEASF